MSSFAVWTVALVAGTAAVGFGATLGQGPHMTITAAVCAGFALLAVLDRQKKARKGSSDAALASATAASMALVWAWAGLSMLVTYQLVLEWHEWWQYVLAGLGVSGLCLAFAWLTAKDDAAGRQDETVLAIARYLAIAQLVGMIVAMAGMILDDKMPRDAREPDWAANAIFFFGAAALAVISANALRGPTTRRT